MRESFMGRAIWPVHLLTLLIVYCASEAFCATIQVDTSNASFSVAWQVNQDQSVTLSLSVDKPQTEWIGLGVTSSSGLGESIMHGGPQGGAAVIARDSTIKEYLLTGSTPSQVVPWLRQLPNARLISLCISQNCLEQTQTCLANPACARTLRCTLSSSNASFIAPILTQGGVFNASSLDSLYKCAAGRINSLDDSNQIVAAGSLMRVVACGLQSCTRKIFEGIPVTTLSASSITRNATTTTLSFTLPSRKLASISFSSSSLVTFLFAAGSLQAGEFVAHGVSNRAFATVDLDNGELTHLPLPGVLAAHIALASIGAGLLVPLALIARSFGRTMWHWAALLFGTSIVFASTGALAYVNGARDTKDSHVGLGFALLLVLTLLVTILAAADSGHTFSFMAFCNGRKLDGRWLPLAFQLLVLGLVPACIFTGHSAIISSAVAASSALSIASALSIFTAFLTSVALLRKAMNPVLDAYLPSEPTSSNRELISSGAVVGKDVEMAVLSSSGTGRAKDESCCEDTPDCPRRNIVPLVLTWENVSIVAPKSRTQDEEKAIVKDAIGFASPRTMTALMGPSGSGKTTLLRTLALRRRLPIGEARVQLNGRDARSFPNIRQLIALLPQQDHLHEYMTTRETLVFAARLILSKLPVEEAVQRALDVARRLELAECLDTRIGGLSSSKGLSGGERKRVSIALQMLKDPTCLFLDEPTTGLDAQLALKLVMLLRSLANEGRIVVASIHQPSKACFDLFDRLVLLSQGRTVLSGPRPTMLSFWASLGLAIPARSNPAEWLLEMVDVLPGEPGQPTVKRKSAGKTAVLDESGTRIAAKHVERALQEFYEQFNPQKLREEPTAVAALVEYACKYGVPALDRQLKTAYNASLSAMLVLVKEREELGSDASTGRISMLASKFAASQWNDELKVEISSAKDLANDMQGREVSRCSADNQSLDDAMSTSGAQIGLLLERALLLLWRNPQALRVQFASTIVFGLLIGALYSEVQFLETGQFLKTVTMAIIVAAVGFVTVSAGVQIAFDDRLVFERELGDAIYTPFPYFAHKALINVPVAFVISLGMIIPAYFWVGLNASREAFFFFVLANALTVIAFDAVVYAIALSVTSLDTAYVLAVFYEGIGMFFSGVSIPAYAMPDYLRWIHYIGPFSYSFGAVVVNQFERTEDEFYIDITGVVVRDKWINLAILFGFGILFRCVAWFAIKRMESNLAIGFDANSS